ncbi:ABC transporter substrate-binding protein [Rhizobium leguminosarum]
MSEGWIGFLADFFDDHAASVEMVRQRLHYLLVQR